MNFWNRNKTVITIQVDYDILFGRYSTDGIDKVASRAEFLKLAKARIEKRYKAKVIAWGVNSGVLKPATVEADQSAKVIEQMEMECIDIMTQVQSEMNWVVRKE